MQFGQIIGYVRGKKTYIIAASAFLSLVVGWLNGTIPNLTFVEDTFGLVLSVALRHGISGVNATTPPIAPTIPPQGTQNASPSQQNDDPNAKSYVNVDVEVDVNTKKKRPKKKISRNKRNDNNNKGEKRGT